MTDAPKFIFEIQKPTREGWKTVATAQTEDMAHMIAHTLEGTDQSFRVVCEGVVL